MKRTWAVYVTMKAGHEYTDLISESEFYGPYTEMQARKLETVLNKLFEDNRGDDIEIEQASAMPLDVWSPRAVMSHYHKKAKDAERRESDDAE